MPEAMNDNKFDDFFIHRNVKHIYRQMEVNSLLNFDFETCKYFFFSSN